MLTEIQLGGPSHPRPRRLEPTQSFQVDVSPSPKSAQRDRGKPCPAPGPCTAGTPEFQPEQLPPKNQNSRCFRKKYKAHPFWTEHSPLFWMPALASRAYVESEGVAGLPRPHPQILTDATHSNELHKLPGSFDRRLRLDLTNSRGTDPCGIRNKAIRNRWLRSGSAQATSHGEHLFAPATTARGRNRQFAVAGALRDEGVPWS